MSPNKNRPVVPVKTPPKTSGFWSPTANKMFGTKKNTTEPQNQTPKPSKNTKPQNQTPKPSKNPKPKNQTPKTYLSQKWLHPFGNAELRRNAAAAKLRIPAWRPRWPPASKPGVWSLKRWVLLGVRRGWKCFFFLIFFFLSGAFFCFSLLKDDFNM